MGLGELCATAEELRAAYLWRGCEGQRPAKRSGVPTCGEGRGPAVSDMRACA